MKWTRFYERLTGENHHKETASGSPSLYIYICIYVYIYIYIQYCSSNLFGRLFNEKSQAGFFIIFYLLILLLLFYSLFISSIISLFIIALFIITFIYYYCYSWLFLSRILLIIYTFLSTIVVRKPFLFNVENKIHNKNTQCWDMSFEIC